MGFVTFFTKADSWLDVVQRWGIAALSLWGALTWLSKQMSRLGQLNWADAMAVGLLGTLATMLAVAASLIAIRYFRPVATPSPQQVLDALPGDEDDLRPGYGELEIDISRIDTAIKDIAKDRKAIIDDYQRMSGLDAKLTDQLTALKDAHRGEIKTLNDRIAIGERNFRDTIEAINIQMNGVHLALQALLARERETFYAEQIAEAGARLVEQIEREEAFTGDDWEQWEKHLSQFESSLYHWLALADAWNPDVRKMIYDIPSEHLTSLNWGPIDELFQNANQVIKYKTEIARLENWNRYRNHIAVAIHHAAFGGPNANELLESIPSGSPNITEVANANRE